MCFFSNNVKSQMESHVLTILASSQPFSHLKQSSWRLELVIVIWSAVCCVLPTAGWKLCLLLLTARHHGQISTDDI